VGGDGLSEAPQLAAGLGCPLWFDPAEAIFASFNKEAIFRNSVGRHSCQASAVIELVR
jgi:hypothetical protein